MDTGCVAAVDLDNSGQVDASELLVAFRHLGLQLNLEEVIAVMQTVDEDESGLIDKDEFDILFKAMNSENGLGECVLCHGKGHNNKPAILQEPHRERCAGGPAHAAVTQTRTHVRARMRRDDNLTNGGFGNATLTSLPPRSCP